MNATLIGYFPKKRQPVPDWFKNAAVTQVCSVSECIVPGPEDWIHQWRHNDLFLFDSPEITQSVLPADSIAGFDIYEYRAFPFRIDRKVCKPWDLSVVSPAMVDSERLEVLGFDMVSRSKGSSFECSPLSCNRFADEWPTNEFCLIDDADTAIGYAAELSVGNAEPGPYCVVRVALVMPTAELDAPTNDSHVMPHP